VILYDVEFASARTQDKGLRAVRLKSEGLSGLAGKTGGRDAPGKWARRFLGEFSQGFWGENNRFLEFVGFVGWWVVTAADSQGVEWKAMRLAWSRCILSVTDRNRL
jgi:hypothetical protein